VKGSQAYQWILANPDETDAPNPYDDSLLNVHYIKTNTRSALLPKVIRTTFNAIKGAVDIELGEQIRNVVITVPDYVKGDLHEPIMRGAEKAGFFLNRDGVVRKLVRGTKAVLAVYILEPKFAVLVKYNEAALTMQLAKKGTVYADTTLSELGEATVTRGSTKHYLDTVKQAIHSWLAAAPKGIPEDVGYAESDIASVVFSGDASPAGFEVLKKASGEVFSWAGYREGWMKDKIDPLYVAAVGAARRGWEMVDNPIKYKLQGAGTHGEL